MTVMTKQCYYSNPSKFILFYFYSRIHLEHGIILLDLEAKDMTQLYFSLVEELCNSGLLNDDYKADILRVLLLK